MNGSKTFFRKATLVALFSVTTILVGGMFAGQAFAGSTSSNNGTVINVTTLPTYVRGMTTINWTDSSTKVITAVNPFELQFIVIGATHNGSTIISNASATQNSTTNLYSGSYKLWDTTKKNNGNSVTPDGTYQVSVTDSTSKKGNFATSHTFNIDNTPPSTTLTTTKVPDSTTHWYNKSTQAPVITLTCTDPIVNGVSSGCSEINYAWYSKATGNMLSGYSTTTTSAVTAAATTAGTASTVSTPVLKVPQGDNILKWSSEDNAVDANKAHNISTTYTKEFKVDTIAPHLVSITPAKHSNLSGVQTFKFNFTDKNLKYLELDFAPEPYTQSTKGQLTLLASPKMGLTAADLSALASAGITPSYTSGSGWAISVDTNATLPQALVGQMLPWITKAGQKIWPDGLFDIYVEVGDSAGNQWGDMNNNSTWGGTKLYTYNFDNTVPVVSATTLTAPNGSEDWAGGSTQNIAWNTSDITDTNLATKPITLSYSTNSGVTNPTWTQITTTGITNSGSYSWTVPSINSSNVKVKITATDKAGNTASDMSDAVFTIDSKNPTLSPVSIVSNNKTNTVYATTGDKITLNFTSSEALNTTATPPTVTIEGMTVTPTNASGTNKWTATYKMIKKDTQGPVTFTINYADLAGNNGTQVAGTTNGSSVIFDNVPPDAPTITQIGNTGNYINSANESSVTVTGKAEADSVVSVILGDGTNTTSAVTATTDSSGDYSATGIDASVLSDGAITATANATDAAGNTGADVTGTATKDTVAPTVSSITTKDISKDGKIDTAVVVFDEPMILSSLTAGDFTVGGVPATGVTASTANASTFIFTISGEVTGTNAKTVDYTGTTATDLAGNPLTTFSGKTSIDKAGPVMLSAKTTSQTTIDATFSEKIKSGTINTTGTEFTVSGGYHVSGAVENTDGVVTLTVAKMPTSATPSVTFNSTLFTDEAGNEAVSPTIVTATDGVAPTLSAVSISSGNANTKLAKEGDTVTLNFTSSEALKTTTTMPAVTIDTKNAVVTNTSGNIWKATYVMGGDTQGIIPFTINYTDLAGNAGTQVTSTDSSNSTSVFYDSVKPVAIAGNDKDVNAQTTQTSASATDNGSGILHTLWSSPSSNVVFDTVTDLHTKISATADGTYILTLTVTDKAGNTNSDTMQFIWDTTNPVEIASTPSNGAINVPTTAGNVSVVFSEPVKSLDTNKVMLTNVSTGKSAVLGAITISDNTIVIPHSAFTNAVQYRINVLPGAVKDYAGNNLSVNFIHSFTTSATPDTTAPVAPVISTKGAIVTNANYYTISGTIAKDSGRVIVNLYNGSSLAGTAVVAMGDTDWTINAKLTPDSANKFTAKATDAVGNTSDASTQVTITEQAPNVVTPTITLDGGLVATQYTVSTAGTRFKKGLQFVVKKTDSYTVTINGVTSSATTITSSPKTITAVSKADATTLGLHSYTVTVMSPTKKTMSETVTYNVNADPVIAAPVITNIQATSISATTATIKWTTDKNATSQVDYGMNSSYGKQSAPDSTLATSHSVTLSGLTSSTGYHFRVVSTDSVNNTTKSGDNTFATVVDNSTATLAVTGKDAVKTYATNDGTFANGWQWTFHVTVPTGETHLRMKFGDFTGTNGSIPVATNLRFYSAQSSNATASTTAITINGPDAYSAEMLLNPNADLSPTTPGRQIDITVGMRVPTTATVGSYSTSYGIDTSATAQTH